MIIYGEALVSDACIDIRTPAAEDVTPVEICHVFLHLVEVHECTHVSYGLVLRHFLNVHDGVVGTGVSQHSHEIFPLHGVDVYKRQFVRWILPWGLGKMEFGNDF